jgi:diguanylate cyclase (GGDEF)-like protein/PAS domain S-box-containing protein
MQLDHETYTRILDNLHDGLYFVDTNRIITYWNKGAERITGFSAAEVLGRSCADNILSHVDGEGNALCFGCCPLAASIADGREREAEVYLHHKDGHRVPVFVRASVLRDTAGKVLGGLELFTDISTILVNSARVQELEKLAMLDTLTLLANRNYLEREFRSCFEKLQRYQESFGVLFIDIDHFKKVNDVYGHDVGDKILQFVATTFTTNSRPFDLYGRWGGEEFIGIIRNSGPEDLALLGNRLRVLIEHSYILHENQKLSVNISLGATMATENDTMDSLIKRADILLYESKAKGRNRLTLG